MTWWLLNKASKVLVHERCGNNTGHKRHVWEDLRETSEHRDELVYCEGWPSTREERFERKLLRNMNRMGPRSS